MSVCSRFLGGPPLAGQGVLLQDVPGGRLQALWVAARTTGGPPRRGAPLPPCRAQTPLVACFRRESPPRVGVDRSLPWSWVPRNDSVSEAQTTYPRSRGLVRQVPSRNHLVRGVEQAARPPRQRGGPRGPREPGCPRLVGRRSPSVGPWQGLRAGVPADAHPRTDRNSAASWEPSPGAGPAGFRCPGPRRVPRRYRSGMSALSLPLLLALWMSGLAGLGPGSPVPEETPTSSTACTATRLRERRLEVTLPGTHNPRPTRMRAGRFQPAARADPQLEDGFVPSCSTRMTSRSPPLPHLLRARQPATVRRTRRDRPSGRTREVVLIIFQDGNWSRHRGGLQGGPGRRGLDLVDPAARRRLARSSKRPAAHRQRGVGAPPAWYHHAWDLVAARPSFDSTDAFSCAAYWGSEHSPCREPLGGVPLPTEEGARRPTPRRPWRPRPSVSGAAGSPRSRLLQPRRPVFGRRRPQRRGRWRRGAQKASPT